MPTFRFRAAPWASLALAVIASTGCLPSRAPQASPRPGGPSGSWAGEARIADASLPIAVTFRDEAGGWTGSVDLPTQYALAYPLGGLEIDPPSIRFSLPESLPPAAFEGALDGDRIRGTVTIPDAAAPGSGTFEMRRRQPPRPAYAVEAVRFRNGDVELAGTIFAPRRGGPHAAVVLVHGSGPQTRDSYLRWFADAFARAGVLALIFDKRGTGESGGERWPRTAGSFTDLADDALAGIRLMRARPDVDAARVGIWGLSQGAWIGPLAASRSREEVAFIVMLSGGGVSPAEQELHDDEVKLRDLGFGEEAIGEALAYLRLADQYVRTGSDEDWERFVRAREAARAEPWYPPLDRFPQILPREAPAWTGLRVDLDYDPAPALAAVRAPILLILGEEDRSTPARETAARVRAARRRGAEPTVRLIPGADHALLVTPGRDAAWVHAKPADGWVESMLDWVRRARH